MKNKLSKYLLSLVLLMSASGMINAQDLIIDHQTSDKLGDEISKALALPGAKLPEEIKSLKVISSNNTLLKSNDIRSENGGLRKYLNNIEVLDFSEINSGGFDNAMFMNYKSLVSISLPSNMTVLSILLFNGCTNLKTVTNWDNVKKIEKQAFDGCINLAATSLPLSLESVGDNAFKGCKGLTANILPSNLKVIGYQAFRESNVTFSEWSSTIQEIGNRAFCISPVTFTTWPKHITTITAGVFVNCNKITEFTIPSSVTVIGGSAFRLSEKTVRNIYISSAIPPTTIADTDESGRNNKNPFSTDANTMANQENVTLHVPATGRDVFKSTEFWKKLAIKSRALSSTTLSGSWTKAELEAMDVTDENLTDIDMTGITVPADVTLDGSTNPNLLVYAKASDNITVDKGFIVKDGQIDNIALTDLKPFNPSKPVSVGSISYSRPASAAFETICLPFDAAVPAGYEVMELSGGTSEQVSLNKVSAMTANTPYMILKSAAETYPFSATGQTISNEMETVTTEAPYDYKGTYLPISVTAENGENIMYISDGTEFRLTGKGASILPFRAFLEGEARSEVTPIQFVKVGGTVNVDKMEQQKDDVYSYSLNGILYLNSPNSRMLNIYGIDGCLVYSQFLSEGESKVTGLNKGIYVIENKKVVVK